jgi:hypothetical protein
MLPAQDHIFRFPLKRVTSEKGSKKKIRFSSDLLPIKTLPKIFLFIHDSIKCREEK